ncbi:MAG: hypothetical protein AAGF87_07785 [Bacteroidota bacterium]
MKSILTLCLILICLQLAGQFPVDEGITPQDASIIGWGDNPMVERGPQQLDSLSLGLASVGTAEDAAGPADLVVISLGEEGMATYIFDPPIADGPDWDIAIFENGFATGNGFFLELAFVEISSDGQTFVRLPNTSLTDTSTQVGTFGVMQSGNLDGLAGKYEGLIGTPFDFSAVHNFPDIDISAISQVRVVDIVGRISQPTRDTEGQIINDPWPTPFASSGFDLDALAYRYIQPSSTQNTQNLSENISVFPNPASPGQPMHTINVRKSDASISGSTILPIQLDFRWWNAYGQPISTGAGSELRAPDLPGLYYLQLFDPDQAAEGVATYRIVVE